MRTPNLLLGDAIDSIGQQPWALYRAARLAESQGDLNAAQAWAEESLAMARALGDKPNTAAALQMLGWLAQCQGEKDAV